MPIKVIYVRTGPACRILALAYPQAGVVPDPCPALAFIQEQANANEPELLKLASLLTRTADSGPPRDDTKFRRLEGCEEIYEFKTSGGLRLLCFWDGNRLIVCTHGVGKLTKKKFQGEIRQAENARREYFDAKADRILLYGPGTQ